MTSGRFVKLCGCGERANVADEQDRVELGLELGMPARCDQEGELQVPMDVADHADVAHLGWSGQGRGSTRRPLKDS